MGLADLTEASVIRAVQEFDELGLDGFLRKYGFRTAREYSVVVDGRRYPSEAIAWRQGVREVRAAGRIAGLRRRWATVCSTPY